ncbi:hypothetical protein BH11PLA2_BH11PLA2_53190 [soil metagenome]
MRVSTEQVQVYLRGAELFGRWLRRRHRVLAEVTDADVRAFVRRGTRKAIPANACSAGNALLRHLQECGLIPPRPTPASTAINRTVADYDAYLQDVAGLADATRLYRRRYAHDFLHTAFGAGPLRWSRLQPAHVRQFINSFGQSGRVAAAQVAAGSLRSFLRWLQYRGRVGSNLAGALPRFPHWRLASLPPTLSDTQLGDLLDTFDTSSPTGRRNHAMALCLVGLGLRVAEVAVLTLSDVDLSAGTLRLAAGKTRRDRLLPMPPSVRQAVLHYIRHDRPTPGKHLFVRHRIPLGEPVTRELIRGVIRRAYARVAGCERLTGTHILRHTAASRLLRAGADLKRIADILGHSSVDTSAIYAKVDIDHLATVAMPWPGTRGVLR